MAAAATSRWRPAPRRPGAFATGERSSGDGAGADRGNDLRARRPDRNGNGNHLFSLKNDKTGAAARVETNAIQAIIAAHLGQFPTMIFHHILCLIGASRPCAINHDTASRQKQRNNHVYLIVKKSRSNLHKFRAFGGGRPGLGMLSEQPRHRITRSRPNQRGAKGA